MALSIHPTFLFFLPRFWRNYYLATPVFILLDAVFGISIRIPFLDNAPALKYIYYMAVFFVGLIIAKAPWSAKYLSIGECALGFVLNISGFMQPLYGAGFGMEELQKAAAYYTPQTIFHFMMTGGLLVVWFYQAQFSFKKN